MDAGRALLGMGAAYLLGSLPWALWLGRWARGIDVRHHGSGNLGATNVYRVLGPGLGLTVLALDVAKGAAGVAAAAAIAGDNFPGGRSVAGLLGGLAAVLGHVFSVWTGFRGGKGVATATGAMIAVAPFPSLLAFAAFVLVLFLTRRISAGSVAGAIVFTLLLWTVARDGAGLPTALVGSLIALLVIVRHVPNLKRLARGEEPAFRFRRDVEP